MGRNQLDAGVATLNPAAVTITRPGCRTLDQRHPGRRWHHVLHRSGRQNHLDEYTGKIDYELSPKQRLTLRSFTTI